MIKQKPKIPSCNECVSDMSSLFRHLTNEQLETLNYDKSCQFYHRGDYVFHEGNRATGCYCIYSGVVKLYKTGIEGKTDNNFSKGDIIGYRSVISRTICTTAQVHEDASLCFIPSDVIHKLIQ